MRAPLLWLALAVPVLASHDSFFGSSHDLVARAVKAKVVAVDSAPSHAAKKSKTGECTQAYIDNKKTAYCKQSCPLNQWPLYQGGCVCRAPNTLHGGVCQPKCDDGFTLSKDRTLCICCDGKYLSPAGDKCTSRCNTGTFDAKNGTCASCPEPYLACIDAATPTRCINGYFFDGKTCVKTCPANSWPDNAPTKNICRKCADKDALTCSDSGKASATACMTNYLLNGVCVAASRIPDGSYGDSTDHTVRTCGTGVKTCTCSSKGCATSCGKNMKNDQLVLTPKGECALHCPSGYYADNKNALCVKCDSTALTCDANGARTCAKGSAGTQLYLTPTRKCILPWVGPAGYYPDSTTNTFKPCLDGVTTCVGDGDNDAMTCGTRSDGTTLFFTPSAAAPVAGGQRKFVTRQLARRDSAPTGTCVEAASCPAATWADPITNVCTACDANETKCKGNGEGSALACASGTYLTQGGDCVSAEACVTSGAFWADDANNVCSTCDAGEAACTGNGAGLATACATNDRDEQLYLYNGDCYTGNACPAAYYPDNNTKSCQACDPGALSCTGPHAATSCGLDSDGQRLYLNIDGNCVTAPNCDSSTWSDPATRHCESCTLIDPDAKTCTSPTVLTCANKFFYQAACIDPCPTRFWANSDNHVCTPCTDPDALTCDAHGALSCDKLLLWQKQCIPTCPAGTYSVGNVCYPCTDKYGPGAATCDASATLSCMTGYVWLGQTCISESDCYAKPDGYYPKNGFCSACSNDWAYATSCTPAGPTACSNNRFVDRNLKCARTCPNGYAEINPNGDGTDYIHTGQYIDDSGFVSTCRSCIDPFAVVCDQYSGLTTQCYTPRPGHNAVSCPHPA
ncbi:extracellular matrix protein FRAS1 [Rhodotorula toruloides]|uniref:Extracellular matrix protein FRAS1 n=1 Tax=Rhodotorula toruloides TaxID=5286 RepID=A0A511KJI7_RHOTO|nr:extracellular matrix protein FRAS1 [Rhodotorula toruloides]